jgi:hypothetical protein
LAPWNVLRARLGLSCRPPPRPREPRPPAAPPTAASRSRRPLRFTYQNNNVYGNGTNYCGNLSGGNNPTGEEGNISQNPQFVTWSDDNNFTNDDFHLQSTSPCHDTGADLSPYGITTDHDGNPRPRGAAYDMGAFEIQE